MRVPRIILAVVLVLACLVGFLWYLPNLINPQYFGLGHKSAKYYTDYTAACDSLLTAYPLGTNQSIEIPVTDTSLQKIMTDMPPIKIKISSNSVWMLLGSDSHAGFGLTWEPQWDNTNIWILHTTAESLDTVIYTSTR
jgi:hypothetical protein